MASGRLNQDVMEVAKSVQVLSSDMEIARQLGTETASQFARRAYVRSVFAAAEGSLNAMAGTIVRAAERNEVEVSTAEESILREQAYGLSAQGVAKTRPSFAPLVAKVRFVPSLFARLFGASFKAGCSGPGWRAFKQAVAIRHQITHPKHTSSLTITDAEIQAVDGGKLWFAATIDAMLASLI